MTGTLSAINIFPVKSCRGTSVERAEVTPSGLAGDRRWQVVDADGGPVTQRQNTLLATVQPSIVDGGLRLEADGRSPIDVVAPTVADASAMTLLGVRMDAADAGDEAADWFSDLLGSPVRLVHMVDGTDCAIPIPGVDMKIGFADAASVLIASESSHAWLAERASEAFGIDRFRANLVISGSEAWVEDTWRDVSVGDARFGYGIPWPRCPIPQIDQRDGSRHSEPAKALKAHRWCDQAPDAPEALRGFFEGNAMFGIGCSVTGAATVTVGDEVTVHETGDRVIPAPA